MLGKQLEAQVCHNSSAAHQASHLQMPYAGSCVWVWEVKVDTSQASDRNYHASGRMCRPHCSLQWALEEAGGQPSATASPALQALRLVLWKVKHKM